ncbi:hypothetical protein D3C86_481650 [compost metagenome]
MKDSSGNPFCFFFKNKKIETDSPTRLFLAGHAHIKKPQPFIVKTEVCFFILIVEATCGDPSFLGMTKNG